MEENNVHENKYDINSLETKTSAIAPDEGVINPEIVNSNGTAAINTTDAQENVKNKGKAASYAKVYFTVAGALVLTFAISLIYVYLLGFVINVDEQTYLNINLGFFISAIVGIVLGSLFITFAPKSKKAGTGLSIAGLLITSTSFGIFLAPIAAFIFTLGTEYEFLAYTVLGALGITILMFFALGLFSAVMKNVKFAYKALLAIGSTLLILCAVNLILVFSTSIFGQQGAFTMYFWINLAVEALIILYFLIITLVDFKRINRMIEAGSLDKYSSLTVGCAMTLYLDFIYIFIRLVIFLFKALLVSGASKK